MNIKLRNIGIVVGFVLAAAIIFGWEGCAVESVAEAQELPLSWDNQEGEPVIELARLFVHLDVGESDASFRRIRPQLLIGHGTCRGRVELNIAATDAVNDRNGNWLEFGMLECTVSDRTKVSLGRLFLSAPYSTPPPFVLPTVEYPMANTFAAYTYGLQIAHTRGDWSFMWDVSGDSGKDFDASDSFDNVETSLRIQRSWMIGDTGFTAQISDDRVRIGLDAMEFAGPKLRYWLGVYHDSGAKRDVQGHIFLSYPVGRFVRPHIQYDWQPNGDKVFTWGAEAFLGKHTRLIIDNADHQWAGRVQFRW